MKIARPNSSDNVHATSLIPAMFHSTKSVATSLIISPKKPYMWKEKTKQLLIQTKYVKHIMHTRITHTHNMTQSFARRK